MKRSCTMYGQSLVCYAYGEVMQIRALTDVGVDVQTSSSTPHHDMNTAAYMLHFSLHCSLDCSSDAELGFPQNVVEHQFSRPCQYWAEFLQIENVDMSVNVDIESHPVGAILLRYFSVLSMFLNWILHFIVWKLVEEWRKRVEMKTNKF